MVVIQQDLSQKTIVIVNAFQAILDHTVRLLINVQLDQKEDHVKTILLSVELLDNVNAIVNLDSLDQLVKPLTNVLLELMENSA
jgi:hypothetical protein